ncbi:hypothetical protein DPMN_072173 [Dreissena polymorpha]|uniref:Uncharacterized protein n=1 Tax=Dreissena polymorpha TaxID=45954 RepID=A0A9D4BQ98_DREPO|nr:hypothetical protein DPMN_072173 [Dreissena polymorpha]
MLYVGDADQSSETFMFMYPAFGVLAKRQCVAAVEKDGDYEGLEEPLLGWEADGTACP